jgi:hypothetical protein
MVRVELPVRVRVGVVVRVRVRVRVGLPLAVRVITGDRVDVALTVLVTVRVAASSEACGVPADLSAAAIAPGGKERGDPGGPRASRRRHRDLRILRVRRRDSRYRRGEKHRYDSHAPASVGSNFTTSEAKSAPPVWPRTPGDESQPSS